MSNKAEDAALKAYPIKGEWVGNQYGEWDNDINRPKRNVFLQGYEQAEKDTIERIISYLGECDLERTILDFDSDGYANIDFESLEKLIRKAMEEE